MEKVKPGQSVGGHAEAPAPKRAPLERNAGSENLKDAFEPVRSLKRSPPNSKGRALIERAREPLVEFIAGQAELPSKLNAKVEEARAELTPDSPNAATRMRRSDFGAFEGTYGKYLMEILKGAGRTVKALNEMKTGRHLSTTLEQTVETETIRPIVERLKANEISKKQAGELLERATKTLLAEASVQEAIRDINIGEKATDVVQEQYRKVTSGQRPSGGAKAAPEKFYSLNDFIQNRFEQLMKVTASQNG